LRTLNESVHSKETQSYDGTTSITTNKSGTVAEDMDDARWSMCYGTSTDLSQMLTTFWPTILEFIDNNPNHDHAVQWQQWIDDGELSTSTELN